MAEHAPTPTILAHRLRADAIVDLGGLLRPAGARQLRLSLERIRGRGLHAFILALPPEASFERVDAIWEALRRDERDLLIVFNGRGWRGRGWGLPIARIKATLGAIAPEVRQVYAHGLTSALDALLAARAEPIAEPPDAEPPWRLIGLGIGVGVLGVGWLIARRRRRAADDERDS